MESIIQISSSGLLFTSLLSITFGVVVLLVPKALNYLVAFYFILIGTAGLITLFA